MFKLQEYIKSSNSVNGTLIQLLTSKECKIIVLFSLKVQTSVPAIHVCMGQCAPTFWMVTLAHARHILQAHDARFLSASRLIHRWKLLQLSLERYRLNYDAFVELHITRVRLAAYRVFQNFVPIVNCILRKAFNASLRKCKLFQVRNLPK